VAHARSLYSPTALLRVDLCRSALFVTENARANLFVDPRCRAGMGASLSYSAAFLYSSHVVLKLQILRDFLNGAVASSPKML